MITTHILDMTEVHGSYRYIDEGDPLIIPLKLVLSGSQGEIYQVNEFDLPSEVVTRQRASMIAYYKQEGREEEIRDHLRHNGLRIFSWTLPAGAEIREVL